MMNTSIRRWIAVPRLKVDQQPAQAGAARRSGYRRPAKLLAMIAGDDKTAEDRFVRRQFAHGSAVGLPGFGPDRFQHLPKYEVLLLRVAERRGQVTLPEFVAKIGVRRREHGHDEQDEHNEQFRDQGENAEARYECGTLVDGHWRSCAMKERG